MARRLLAEDLLLLCWNAEKGTVASACATALAPGIGGALVLDAVLAGALAVEDGRVLPTGVTPDDPLLGEIVAEAGRGRRPPTVKKLVERAGTVARWQAVRDRLVADGVLRRTRQRVLGIIPTTRFPVADPAQAEEVRGAVRALLTGALEPADADAHLTLLAGLAKPTNVIDLLVDRSQRKEAKRRAESFTHPHEVPEAVSDAIKQVEAATLAAVTAVIAASSAASSSSSGSS